MPQTRNHLVDYEELALDGGCHFRSDCSCGWLHIVKHTDTVRKKYQRLYRVYRDYAWFERTWPYPSTSQENRVDVLKCLPIPSKYQLCRSAQSWDVNQKAVREKFMRPQPFCRISQAVFDFLKPSTYRRKYSRAFWINGAFKTNFWVSYSWYAMQRFRFKVTRKLLCGNTITRHNWYLQCVWQLEMEGVVRWT